VEDTRRSMGQEPTQDQRYAGSCRSRHVDRDTCLYQCLAPNKRTNFDRWFPNWEYWSEGNYQEGNPQLHCLQVIGVRYTPFEALTLLKRCKSTKLFVINIEYVLQRLQNMRVSMPLSVPTVVSVQPHQTLSKLWL
jgi:hypothetical protein